MYGKNKRYIINDIRPDLLKQFKIFCAQHDITMRSCFIDYMEKVVSHSKMDKHSPNIVSDLFDKGGK